MQDMLYENSNAALKLVVTHLEEHAANAVFLLKAQAARAIPAPLELAAMLSNCRMQEQMVILGTHNMEREKHGVTSLYWDSSASDFAGGHLSGCPGAMIFRMPVLRDAPVSIGVTGRSLTASRMVPSLQGH